MTTSGTTTYNMYRIEIINAALRKVGVPKPTPQDMSDAADALNVIVKSLDNDGVRLWKSEWYTKAISSLSNEVTGTDSEVYTCILSHTGAATNRPITGADWPIYWVKLGSTGGVWAAQAYTSAGDFAVDSAVSNVERMTIRYNAVDTDIDIINRFGYANIFDKSDFGIPDLAWVDYSQTPPRVHLNRIPDIDDYVIRYLGVSLPEDFTYGSNTADFPSRWLKALIYMLADDLADEKLTGEAGIIKARNLKAKADMYKREAKSRDTETTTKSVVEPLFHSRRRV